MRRAALALLALVSACALPTMGCSAEPKTAAAKSAVDPAFGAKVRAYLLQHPEVIQEAIDRLQQVQAEKLAAASTAAIRDNRKAIEQDARDPVAGDKAALVTVTEFFDYRCPYCKAAAPAMPAFLARHADVRLVYKEFPILSEASEHAAKLALAARLQGKYQAVHTALMVAPALTDDAIDTVLKDNGVDVVRAHRDAQSPAIQAQLDDAKKLARALGVGGTPAFIVGDNVSNGWVPDELDQFIAVEEKKSGRKTAAVGQ